MRKVLVFIIGLFLFGSASFAQEVLLNLPNNPVLTGYAQQKSYKVASSTLSLPFFDDFSQTKIEPDANLWGVHSVFINNDYSKGAPSVGVATFDAVAANGYHHSGASSTPFISDMLISQLIDLSEADLSTTWLSFYFQPQGYGNAPEFNDSLILEFTGQGADWHTVWYANGSEFLDFRENELGIDPIRTSDTNEFKLIMIPVDSTVYQSSEFRFRFKNYASLSGENNYQAAVNCDHWNVDYVFLDQNRSIEDTVFKDVAFVDEPNSFLRLFESVPWSHYRDVQKAELSREYLNVRNNNSRRVLIPATEFIITDTDTREKVDSFNVGTLNIEAGYNSNSDWKFDKDPLFEVEGKQELNVEYELRLTTNDDYPQNNSTTKDYHFLNYYAYDDGTAENAYGIESNDARVAVKYKAYTADVLTGVSMYILPTNPIDEGATSISLCVWDDNNGVPGDILLIESGDTAFSSSLNKFVQYELSEPVNVDGDFYIGWIQKSALRMNVGFDKNKNNKSQLFYNIYGNWENSDFAGSLMMRPLFGTITGNSINLASDVQNVLKVYPNPASSHITIKGFEDDTKKQVYIYNTLGQLQHHCTIVNEPIDVSLLQRGIYVINVSNNVGKTLSTKLVITK